jgi:putative selenium metabolism protein SsnA
MLVINGKLVTWEKRTNALTRLLEGYALLIQEDRIVALAPQDDLVKKYPEESILDAAGQLVMPGNICAHTHFYGAFARGLAIPGPAPADFPEILRKLWWPLDLSLDEESVRISALVSLVDAIRHGTTTLVDHHASPNFIDGSLDVIAEAVDQSGLRAVLCYEVTDRNGASGMRQGIQENVRFIERTRRDHVAGGRVQASFGLHAGLTLSDTSLDACCQAAPANSGFHIHIAEHEVDEYDALAKSGMRAVSRLRNHCILGPRSIAAHCVHIDRREQEILLDSGTFVTHQPRSNMNNGVGVADVEGMLAAGIPVCLGNDGFSNAMWEEWKTAYLVHKVWHRDPRRMNGMDVVRMGVYNNARLAKAFWQDAPLGALIPGAYADLIFVDYHPFTPMTIGNLPWHILFGFHESMVTMTMVAGKILMYNRVLLTLDEQAIAARGREIAPQVWERYNRYAS